MTDITSLLNKFNLKSQNSGLFLFLVSSIYLIVAVNSVGFHHYDEHFQIVEFANYKMGWIGANKLTWEFKAGIRPGLQPFICFVIFNVCQLFKETDGYNLALVLRIITATFSIAALNFLVNSYRAEISKKLYPYFFLLSYFLWFLPYINVRFSSETWSGIFLILTIAVIQTDKNNGAKKRYFLIGLLLGISTLLRYQSCLFVLGIGLWFILIDKIKTKGLVACGAALLLTLAIGFLIDRWLYGAYTFTFYNYFNVNIIKNIASRYGTLPWYWIILYIIKAPGPLGILIFASFFILLTFDPKNILLWAVAPFLIVHSIVPHKELRFLFPVANLCPLFMILTYQHVKGKFKLKADYLPAVLFVFLIIFNTAGLIAIAFTGASGQVAVTNFIHRKYKGKHISLILNDVNPYIEGPPLYNTFYDGRGIDRHYIPTFWKENLFKYKKRDTTVLLVMREDDFTGPRNVTLFKEYGLVKVYQNIPGVVESIYHWYDKSLNDSSIWIYEMK